MKRSKSYVFVLGFLFASFTCTTAPKGQDPIDYRSKMVSFVSKIKKRAHVTDPSFFIIAQNGESLLTTNGESDSPINQHYINIIDGIAREDVFYGYEKDNVRTSSDIQEYITAFLNRLQDYKKKVMVVDYCSTYSKIVDSYTEAESMGYISFAAPHRGLNSIPVYEGSLIHENKQNIKRLETAQNFLYIINPGSYNSKADFITALEQTNYDIIVIDYVLQRGEPFSKEEITKLKTKANGGQRLIAAYMSIGEAEDYRYYWRTEWSQTPPVWLEPENPNWAGNYPVQYWNRDWQKIICGTGNSYLSRILSAGFDGLYLDRIDAYEYFEN